MAGLYFISMGNGLAVPHTAEERERLWKGVDRPAAQAAARPLVFDGTVQADYERVMGPGKP